MAQSVPDASELRAAAFATAYRVLGNPTSAEDIAHDSLERWLGSDRKGIVEPRAYVATIAARLSLNLLRNAKRRRAMELPIPLGEPDSDGIDARLDLSYGLLTLTLRLTPLARAVFVLRTGFDLSFDEIARCLNKSAAGCRQVFKRANAALALRRDLPVHDVLHQQRLLASLAAGIAAGDVAGVEKLLANDVALFSDGGGVAPDTGKPLLGAATIARFLVASPKIASSRQTASLHRGPQGAILAVKAAGSLSLLVLLEANATGIISLFVLSDPRKLAVWRESPSVH